MIRRALPSDCLDLLASLQATHFKHPAYDAIITILGQNVVCDGNVVDQLDSEEKIQFIWSEFLHQTNVARSREKVMHVAG